MSPSQSLFHQAQTTVISKSWGFVALGAWGLRALMPWGPHQITETVQNSCNIAIFFLTWLYMAKIVSLWPKSVPKTIPPTSLCNQFQGTIPQHLGPLAPQSEP